VTPGDRWIHIQAWTIGLIMLASLVVSIAGWF
jgi:hypothetical protein